MRPRRHTKHTRSGIGGFVPISNRVYDGLMFRWPLSKAAHQVLSWIIRASWGWGRVWTRSALDVSSIVGVTGLHRTTVWDVLKILETQRYISNRKDGRVRVNRCVLASRYQVSNSFEQAPTVTPSNAYATVAKPLRTRSEKATHALPNGYSPSADLQQQHSLAEPYRHVQTMTDTTDKELTASQYPVTRDESSKASNREVSNITILTHVQESDGRGRSLAQRLRSADCRDVLSYWRDRFDDANSDYAWAGLIIKGCSTLSVSPIWLIDQVPLDHPNPRSRLMGYLNHTYPVPELPDRERRKHSFWAWSNRKRPEEVSDGIRSFAEVLAGITRVGSTDRRQPV